MSELQTQMLAVSESNLSLCFWPAPQQLSWRVIAVQAANAAKQARSALLRSNQKSPIVSLAAAEPALVRFRVPCASPRLDHAPLTLIARQSLDLR